jgi:hypothetical protein
MAHCHCCYASVKKVNEVQRGLKNCIMELVVVQGNMIKGQSHQTWNQGKLNEAEEPRV